MSLPVENLVEGITEGLEAHPDSNKNSHLVLLFINITLNTKVKWFITNQCLTILLHGLKHK